MPCVPQPVRRTAADVSAVLGLVLLASVIILALSLPLSAAYGADTLSASQGGARYEPEPSGGTAGPNPPGPANPTEAAPPTDPDPPNPSPSTHTQPAPPEPSPTKADKTKPAEKTKTAVTKTTEAKPASRSGTLPAPAPAEVTVARHWEPRVLPALDHVPSPGSVPRSDHAPRIDGLGEEGDAARLAAAQAAIPAPPRWPDQAFGISLVTAGVISLAFSVGGIVVVALRRRRW